MGKALFLACALSLLPVDVMLAQVDNDSATSSLSLADRSSRHSIAFPFSLIVPEGIRLGYDMRAYIASLEFGTFDSSTSPEDVFNEIYFESVTLAHGNLPVAFLAASFGSFEHEYIPLNFFGAELDLPLTSESHSRFLTRVSHLPTHLYHTPDDDRDKIQHFFASAWLKSILGMDWLVRLAGEAVEEGETLFVIGDSRDPRDVHANSDGLHFEIQAERNLEKVPSESITKNP